MSLQSLRTRLLVAYIGLIVLGFGAQAQSCKCTGAGATQITDTGSSTTLTTTISGSTACVAKAGGGWESQEQHRTGGQLWDYKLGPTSTVDPTEQIGTWVVSGNGAQSIVTYTYGAQVFPYKVCRVSATSTSYGFCSTAGSTIMATLKPSISSCP